MILPPIPTPFDREGRLDEEAFRELAQALEPLVDGLLVYGSNGEGVHLTPEERARGLRALRPRKPFLVGLMEETLPQAEGALLEAKAAGAMALLATPPRYYHGSLGAGLLRYYEALAEKMPLFLYHVPQNTKVDLPSRRWRPWPRTRTSSASRTPAATSAGSPSTRPASRSSGSTPATPPPSSAPWPWGRKGILAAANLAPRAYRALLDHFREGRLAEAQELQKKLFPLGDLLAKGGVPLLKQALRHLGLPAGYPRPPTRRKAPFGRGSSPSWRA